MVNNKLYIGTWLSINNLLSLSGTVKTTWKYFTGSRSASLAIIHFSLSIPPHFGQCLLRQLLCATLICPQLVQASTWPPMYWVLHFCKAFNVRSLWGGEFVVFIKRCKKVIDCSGQFMGLSLAHPFFRKGFPGSQTSSLGLIGQYAGTSGLFGYTNAPRPLSVP